MSAGVSLVIGKGILPSHRVTHWLRVSGSVLLPHEPELVPILTASYIDCALTC
jgi:hypothetical protein